MVSWRERERESTWPITLFHEFYVITFTNAWDIIYTKSNRFSTLECLLSRENQVVT